MTVTILYLSFNLSNDFLLSDCVSYLKYISEKAGIADVSKCFFRIAKKRRLIKTIYMPYSQLATRVEK